MHKTTVSLPPIEICSDKMMVPLVLSLPRIAPHAASSARAALIVANAADISSFEVKEEHLVWNPSFAPQFAIAATACAVAAFIVSHSPLAQQPNAWYPLYDNVFVRTGLSSLAGLLSSSCCLLQIMLNAFSIGCAGFNTVLGPARPYFMALALTLQALMWQAVITDATPLEPAITSTALTSCLTFLPEALNVAMQRSAVPSAEDDLRLRVDGMGCTACSVKVKAALESVDGVSACTVVFEEGCAQLQLDPSGFGAAEERAGVEQRAIAALTKAGFAGTPAAAESP
jgi:copper chaperone CopZ